MSDEIAELRKRIEDLETVAVIKHVTTMGIGTGKGKLMRMLDEGIGIVLKPLLVDGRMTLQVEGVPAEPAVPPPVKVSRKPDPMQKMPDKKTFGRALAELLNRHNIEAQSNTPDYVLAEYLIDCLDAWSRMSHMIRDKHLDTFTGKI
jgi:hypothetical protein